MSTLIGTGSAASFGAGTTGATGTTGTRTINHRGGGRSAAVSREQSSVYGTSMGIGIGHLHAEVRRQEMLAEAEQARRLSQAGVGGSRPAARVAVVVVALRRAIGATLVRAGERLQGAGAGAAEPADVYPSAATLHAAR